MNPLDYFRGLLNATPSDGARRLASILEVRKEELPSIRLGRKYYYRPAVVPKPNGGERRLLVPSPDLKMLQRRLLDGHLGKLLVHWAATAFRRYSSAVLNAKQHAGNQFVATVDLRDFFASTRAARINAYFRQQGWRGQELATLMRLCVFRGGLPQGAPTSPCLSNLVNFPLDDRLVKLCRHSGATYTRYGDDMTFSWAAEVMPGGFRAAVEDLLGWAGYEAQPIKGWTCLPISARPVVTGIVLRGHGRIGFPWEVRRRVWALRVRSWFASDPGLRERLRGYDGYMRSLK